MCARVKLRPGVVCHDAVWCTLSPSVPTITCWFQVVCVCVGSRWRGIVCWVSVQRTQLYRMIPLVAIRLCCRCRRRLAQLHRSSWSPLCTTFVPHGRKAFLYSLLLIQSPRRLCANAQPRRIRELCVSFFLLVEFAQPTHPPKVPVLGWGRERALHLGQSSVLHGLVSKHKLNPPTTPGYGVFAGWMCVVQ